MFKRYKHLVIEDPDEPPTADEIQVIENLVGAKLPPDFLDFLMVGNGGSLDDYQLTIPLTPVPEVMSFGRIFTTKANVESFHKNLELARKYRQIPDKVLPIADDGGGSYLYLDLRELGACPVIAFIHGLPSWTGLHQQDELIQVATNFSEYLLLLEFDASDYKELLLKAIAEKNGTRIEAIVEYLDLAMPNWRQAFGVDNVDGLSQ